MMHIVERHPVENAGFLADNAPRLAASFERNLSLVTQLPKKLTTLMDTALLELGSRCALDPQATEQGTWDSLARASQASCAIFESATTASETSDCLINGEFYPIPRIGPTHFSTPNNWLTALWLAMITRDFARLRMLAAVDESIFQPSRSDYDTYIYSWINTLQAYFSDQAEQVAPNFEATSRLLAPEHTEKSSATKLRLTTGPQLLLFLELASANEDGFNEALGESLESHREFWSPDASEQRSPVGYIALAPLAMACVAHDSGMNVQVESDYLPVNLLTGYWTNAFQF
ncbi:immunity 49 family protein [Saccharopolyspora sp. CA-218241]|uniref:immunity 49 family protein n=1 Tax=Saccharopolyspora sp. CA-218241 TaxID=3240027 RepID=UPI003D970056